MPDANDTDRLVAAQLTLAYAQIVMRRDPAESELRNDGIVRVVGAYHDILSEVVRRREAEWGAGR